MKYSVQRPGEGRITLEDARDFLVFRLGSGHTVEIFDLQVGSERRKGKGRRLVDLLLRDLLPPGTRSVYAITRISNLIAQEFYTAMRFRPILLGDFYKDDPLKSGQPYADAVMFVKDLTGGAA